MEKEPKNESGDKLKQVEVQEFITRWKIQAEDFHLIEKLASFQKNLLIEYLHNTFNMYKDRAGEQLKSMLKYTRDESKVELLETALEFYNKYGWANSWNLVRILEEI